MRSSGRCLLVVFVVSLFCAPLRAQAWLGPKGEATVSLTYQHSDFEGHLSEKGARDYHGSSRSRSLDLGIDYGVTDRLVVSASLPYVGTRNGPDKSPVSGFEGADDGRYHSTWQDYHFEARYNLLNGSVALTPFAGVVIPSHHYAVFAEAGTGRDLRELQAGVNLGKLLTPKWHQPYVEARLLYAVPQRVLGVSTRRTGIDAGLGLFVTPSLSIRGVAIWQRTHGGLTADQVFAPFPPTPNPNLDPELFRQHDRLLRDNHVRAGLAGSWALNATTDVYGGWIRTVSGTNTHFGSAVSVGVSRTLKPSS